MLKYTAVNHVWARELKKRSKPRQWRHESKEALCLPLCENVWTWRNQTQHALIWVVLRCVLTESTLSTVEIRIHINHRIGQAKLNVTITLSESPSLHLCPLNVESVWDPGLVYITLVCGWQKREWGGGRGDGWWWEGGMQRREDGKLVSGRCYCGLSAGAYSNKGKGQCEVERSTLTPRKPTQREVQIRGSQKNNWRNRRGHGVKTRAHDLVWVKGIKK